MPEKPLGMKAYGSIGHLPGSRLGPGDHHVHEGQARICTEQVRDRHDRIIVAEKLDGSCTAVVFIEGRIVALGRAGYPAGTSPYEQHKMFAAWVGQRDTMFRRVLCDGERLVGEWLAQAHGTRYDLDGHSPWQVFDLMRGHDRASYDELRERVKGQFEMPHIISDGSPMDSEELMAYLDGPYWWVSAAVDPPEGAVWRVESRGEFDFLAKWVRPDKVDGRYLPEISGGEPVWNWLPESR